MSATITSDTQLGGQTYPFLERLLAATHWAIHTHHISDIPDTADVSLRWLNDNHVVDVHVPGMGSAEFLAAVGLELDLSKGSFILSKRLSRIMRPYFISSFFPAEDVTITYLDLDDTGRKVWDGAGQMSRQMADRLIDRLPDELPADQRRQLIYSLRHDKRFEFTLLTERGQDKGHCTIIDDLEADFVLPRDTKTQVKLVDGTVFVGLQPVHGADHMRLDIQSLINLHPFFQQEQLLGWLRNESDLFFEAITSGEVTAMMGLLDPARLTLEDVQSWYVREYLLCGGHPMWLGHIVKALVRQHLKRLNHQALGKMRLPVPGGRYYVMTDTVGGQDILPGQVKLAPAAITAWVNHADWTTYQAAVWGGADQDDALWCFPFRDHDNTSRVLLWRSPNQVGEYVLLEPTSDSFVPGWHSSNELPTADSRVLPPRIDMQSIAYLNLVDDTDSEILEMDTYSPAIMDSAISRAQANRGCLGSYCNTLLLAKALYDRLPQTPPAPLETVIDASVKTGADLSRVRAWCQTAAQHMLKQGKPIPNILQDRLTTTDDGPPIITSWDHWLDELVANIQEHITIVEEQRDCLMIQAMPPQVLFDVAHEEKHYADGAAFNSRYTRTLLTGYWPPRPADYEHPRQICEAYLANKDAPQVIRAALAHYYLNDEHNGNAAACWQHGQLLSDGGRAPGIAQMTLAALREIGLLDELDQVGEDLLVYPGASIEQPRATTTAINGVWMNWLKVWCQHHDKPVPQQMSDVPPAQANWAKQQITRQYSEAEAGPTVIVRQDGERKIAYTERGNLFGYIARANAASVPVGRIILSSIQAMDGNMRCTYTVVD